MPSTTEKKHEDKQKTLVTSNINRVIGKIDPNIIITADYITARYKRPILGVAEMADLLQVKRASIFTYIQQHKIPFKVTKIGKDWITTPLAVATYIVENAQDRSEFCND